MNSKNERQPDVKPGTRLYIFVYISRLLFNSIVFKKLRIVFLGSALYYEKLMSAVSICKLSRIGLQGYRVTLLSISADH